jgi:hypothetical protein
MESSVSLSMSRSAKNPIRSSSPTFHIPESFEETGVRPGLQNVLRDGLNRHGVRTGASESRDCGTYWLVQGVTSSASMKCIIYV